MQCACAMSSVAYPTLKHFSTLSHKRYDFRRKGLLGRTAGFRGNFATYRYVWRCGRELRTIPTVQRSTHSATLYPQCNASSCPLVFLLCPCVESVCVSICFHKMVSEILKVVGEYVQQLQGMSYVPPFFFQRGLYRDDGGPNRLFFTYLFCDKALAVVTAISGKTKF